MPLYSLSAITRATVPAELAAAPVSRTPASRRRAVPHRAPCARYRPTAPQARAVAAMLAIWVPRLMASQFWAARTTAAATTRAEPT